MFGFAQLRAVLVAGDPDVDRRDLQAADRADHLLAALLLDHVRGQVADEAAGLVRRVRQALDVRVLLERRDVDRVVGDREVRVGELLGELVGRVREQEARRDDDVRRLADRGRQVRDVVAHLVRLQRERLDAELALRLVQALELGLVERPVVELADVADERSGDVAVIARAGRGPTGTAVVVAAAAATRRTERDHERQGRDERPTPFVTHHRLLLALRLGLGERW